MFKRLGNESVMWCVKNRIKNSVLLSFIAALLSSHSVFAASNSVIITVAKGFGINLYASDLGDIKQLALGNKGTLFVGSQKKGTIQALVDQDGDGRVDKHYIVAKGLNRPTAIAFHQGSLYAAVDTDIIRFDDIEERLRRPSRPKKIFSQLPESSKRSRRALKFSPDGQLYVAIEAPCNVCEAEAPYGTIIAIDVATGSSELVASGIRSVTGFDWSPDDNKLWFADQGRNWMGDRLPPDEINRVETLGEHFGFPYLHASSVVEPAYEKPANLKINKPIYELPAHVTPTGLLFYRGKQFPQKYHNQLFVAENGSWNRSSKIGYQVMMLHVENHNVSKRTILASFLDGEFPVASPYDLVMAPDGALFISDDLKGNIYRLYYKGGDESASRATEQEME